jgi:hypothetical protein
MPWPRRNSSSPSCRRSHGAPDGVGVDAHDRGEVFGGWEPLAGLGFALGELQHVMTRSDALERGRQYGVVARGLVDVDGLESKSQAVAGVQLAAADVFAVDGGAVCGVEVLDNPGAITEQESCVAARHGRFA